MLLLTTDQSLLKSQKNQNPEEIEEKNGLLKATKRTVNIQAADQISVDAERTRHMEIAEIEIAVIEIVEEEAEGKYAQ